MTQKLYIRTGTASSYDLRQVIKDLTTGSCVISGGTITGGGSSTYPSITITEYSAVTDTGYIIEDDDVTVLTFQNTADKNYTIILELIESSIIGTNKATFKLVDDLYTTYANSIVFGWLLYTGAGLQPTANMIYESPRGLNTGNSNMGWRDIKFPISTQNYRMEYNRACGNGIYQYASDTFTPTPPDTYFIQTPATFTSTVAEPYNLSAVTGNTVTFTIDSLPQTFTINGSDYTDPTSAASLEVCSAINGQLTGVSATVVTSTNFIKLETTGVGENKTIQITGTSDINILTILGWGTTAVSPQYKGTDTLDPFYETYTVPAGTSGLSFWHTTQFNIKDVPSEYEWRFTIPTTNINFDYFKVSLNGITYPSDYIQATQETVGANTIGYKLRFLNKDILQQYVGGVITIYVQATISTTLTAVQLVHYYHALNQWSYPITMSTIYFASTIADPTTTAPTTRSQYVEVLNIPPGTQYVDNVDTTTADGATWEYTVTDGTNSRIGKLQAAWNTTPASMMKDTADLSYDVPTPSATSNIIFYNVMIGTSLYIEIENATAANWNLKMIRTLIKN